MKRIGLYVDVSNIYYCIGKKFDKRKLDYKKYLEYVKDLGQLDAAIAYGCHMKNEAYGFIHCLKELGYTTKFKTLRGLRRKASWGANIAVDIVQNLDALDLVVIGSADEDLKPIVTYCIEKGKTVLVLACGISKDLKESASEFVEIPESFLEVK